MTRRSRLLVAASLATTALLSLLWGATEPDFSGGYDDRLASIADGGVRVQISALAFAFAQLPFIVGMAGLARWLQPSRLATVGGVLAVLAGFGHSVYAGVMLSQTVMAGDGANAAVYAGLMEDLENAPVLIPFMAMGLLGLVFGVLFLSIAWWRSRTEPRWVPLLLWAFLVVEFVGGALSGWASYLSGLLYVVALVAIAIRMVQTGRVSTATSATPAVEVGTP